METKWKKCRNEKNAKCINILKITTWKLQKRIKLVECLVKQKTRRKHYAKTNATILQK